MEEDNNQNEKFISSIQRRLGRQKNKSVNLNIGLCK